MPLGKPRRRRRRMGQHTTAPLSGRWPGSTAKVANQRRRGSLRTRRRYTPTPVSSEEPHGRCRSSSGSSRPNGSTRTGGESGRSCAKSGEPSRTGRKILACSMRATRRGPSVSSASSGGIAGGTRAGRAGAACSTCSGGSCGDRAQTQQSMACRGDLRATERKTQHDHGDPRPSYLRTLAWARKDR